MIDLQHYSKHVNFNGEYGMLYFHAISKMLQGMGYTEKKIEECRKMSTKDLARQMPE